MDQDKMVKSMRKVADKIISENGQLNLCMLVVDEDMDTFTLFVSAKWLDDIDIYEGTRIIVKYIFEAEERDIINQISKVKLIRSTDPGVLFINNFYNVKNSIVRVNNCRLNNVLIPKAILFEASILEND